MQFCIIFFRDVFILVIVNLFRFSNKRKKKERGKVDKGDLPTMMI